MFFAFFAGIILAANARMINECFWIFCGILFCGNQRDLREIVFCFCPQISQIFAEAFLETFSLCSLWLIFVHFVVRIIYRKEFQIMVKTLIQIVVVVDRFYMYCSDDRQILINFIFNFSCYFMCFFNGKMIFYFNMKS